MKATRSAVRLGVLPAFFCIAVQQLAAQDAIREERFREGREQGILPYVVEEQGRSVPREYGEVFSVKVSLYVPPMWEAAPAGDSSGTEGSGEGREQVLPPTLADAEGVPQERRLSGSA